MIFSNKASKFGKGTNISVYMNVDKEIYIYYFNKGIMLKKYSVINQSPNIIGIKASFPYNEVSQIDDNFFVTRLDRNFAIISNQTSQ